jgi:GT2 family glycosyltransferase
MEREQTFSQIQFSHFGKNSPRLTGVAYGYNKEQYLPDLDLETEILPEDSLSAESLSPQDQVNNKEAEASPETKTYPEVTVVIVNYKTRNFLRNCLKSLADSSGNLNLKINVVDNCSEDGSVEMVKNEFPDVNLIENSKNLGFSRANNLVIRTSQSPFILLLNPDTVLESDTLSKLLDFMEENKGVGVVTPKLVRPDGRLDLGCRRGFPTVEGILARGLGLSFLFPKDKKLASYHLLYLDENQTSEVDAVAGAFMLVRNEVIQQVGVLDESFFLFGEDLDWCYRIKQADWKVFYYPEAKAVHFGRQSRKQANLRSTWEFYKAADLFYQKHYAQNYSPGVSFLLRGTIKVAGIGALLWRTIVPRKD